jgi:hypothetical protein
MTPVQMFLRRMQWRPVGSSTPEPVVALLGPHGSGKSTALRALSRECRGTIVHARLDFTEHSELDPISAVAFVAFSLMRGWSNLHKRPVFHRLGLSLLALNERLDPDRTRAQQQIKRLIRQYLQQQSPVHVAEQIAEPLMTAAKLAGAVSGIVVPQPVAVSAREQAKPVIGALLRGAARWGLRDAMRWHHSIPEAEDATTVDSLIALSTSRSHALNHVMNALLADIEDFTRGHPPARAKCDCTIPDSESSRDHEHVWLLLLDNTQTTTGDQFLQALVRAKHERSTVPADAPPDPLLVVTTLDQWRPAWGQWWREPWQTASAAPHKQPVPLFSMAERSQWVRHHEKSAGPRMNPAGGWYPVWLDPTPARAVFRSPTSTQWDPADLEMLASRLASGHPAALLDLQAQADALAPTNGGEPSMPGTILDTTDEAGIPLWKRAVDNCRPGLVPADRPWRAVPPAVMVAAVMSEPGRQNDDLPAERFPGATQTLRELRTALWISTFAARPSPLWAIGRGEQEHPAALHPWLSRCLLAGLAAESDSATLSKWDALFAGISDDAGERGRVLFGELARGRFGMVVKELAGLFDTIDHRAWIRVLDDATSAPCRLPHRESFAAAYRRLVPDHVPGRTPVEAAVTSLTALLWLWRDPLTVPGLLHGTSPQVPWHKQLRTDFAKLVHGSARADVGALEEAASQFEFLT